MLGYSEVKVMEEKVDTRIFRLQAVISKTMAVPHVTAYNSPQDTKEKTQNNEQYTKSNQVYNIENYSNKNH